MSNAELVVLVIQSIPYHKQAEYFDTLSEQNAIRFTWRGNRFRVSQNLHVEEVDDSFLRGSDLAILLQHILEITRGA